MFLKLSLCQITWYFFAGFKDARIMIYESEIVKSNPVNILFNF